MKKFGVIVTIVVFVWCLLSGVAFANDIIQPDFGAYMKDLQRQMKYNWNPPKADENSHAVVLFSINKDGQLLKSKLIKSSGNPEYDKAALKTLELTQPFKPLPQEFTGQSVDVQFTFDYNVYKNMQKTSDFSQASSALVSVERLLKKLGVSDEVASKIVVWEFLFFVIVLTFVSNRFAAKQKSAEVTEEMLKKLYVNRASDFKVTNIDIQDK